VHRLNKPTGKKPPGSPPGPLPFMVMRSRE